MPGSGPHDRPQPAAPPIRAIVRLTYKCTSRCRFCRVDRHRGRVGDTPFGDVVVKMSRAKELGVQMILFSGGEPTLRRDLAGLARAATALGLRFGLITNARRLAYPGYRKALLDLGLAYVHTSLHGANAPTHDHLVQSDSFTHVLSALKGLAGTGVELHVNTVINKLNVGELEAISDLLAGLGPSTHKLCLMEPMGLYERFADELELSPTKAAHASIRTLQRADRLHPGLRTELEGFPLCLVSNALDRVAGLDTHNIRFMSEPFEDDFFPTDHGRRVFLGPCSACAARDVCPGVYEGHARRHGTEGLTPFRHAPGMNPAKPRRRAG